LGPGKRLSETEVESLLNIPQVTRDCQVDYLDTTAAKNEIITLLSRKTPQQMRDLAVFYTDHSFAVVPLWWAENGFCGCGNPNCATPAEHVVERLLANPRYEDDDEEFGQFHLDFVREWFAQEPRINIGLSTKTKAVVRIRTQSGADWLQKQLGPDEWEDMQQVSRAVANGEGRYYLFNRPYSNGISTGFWTDIPSTILAEGVEIVADGGIIPLPPSRTAFDAEYRWVKGKGLYESTILKFPPALMKLVIESLRNKTTSPILPFSRLQEALASTPEDPDWLWDGFLAPRTVTLLAGLPKSGKSSLVFALLASITHGDNFLGRKTREAGALVLSEEAEGVLGEKVRPEILEHVHILPIYKAFGHQWEAIIKQAVEYCKTNSLSVLVVDTLAEWVGWKGDDENRPGAVLDALRPLKDLAITEGLAVLLVHHQRKRGGDHGTAVRGSGALTGGVDIIVELERPTTTLAREETARVLKTLSRYPSTPRDLVFAVAEESVYEVRGDVASATVEIERQRVRDALTSEPIPTGTVADLVHLNRSTVGRHLQHLCTLGLVGRQGNGTRGDPYLWKEADTP
jgi:hypothetical protein